MSRSFKTWLKQPEQPPKQRNIVDEMRNYMVILDGYEHVVIVENEPADGRYTPMLLTVGPDLERKTEIVGSYDTFQAAIDAADDYADRTNAKHR